MIENPFAPITPDRLAMIENPFAATSKPDGKLTPERWRVINQLIGRTNGLQHDELIADFCDAYGLSRRRLKAEIKTYRLASPPMLQ